MRKQYIALFLLISTSISSLMYGQSPAISLEEEDFSELDRARGDLPFYKTRAFQAGAAGLAAGGALGSGTAYLFPDTKPEMPEEVFIGVAGTTGGGLGAVTGATLGAITERGTKYWIRHRINSVLKKYTLYTFQNLQRPEAALILAAHRENLTRMKKLAPRLEGFISKEGVLQALTEIYLKHVPSAENLAAMQLELFGPPNYQDFYVFQ